MMKITTWMLLIMVLAFSSFWLLQAKQFIIVDVDTSGCFYKPDCECIDRMYKGWSIEQKNLYLKLMRLDFIYMVFYGLLLGFMSYIEMQKQKVYWLNNLLRFNVFVLVITLLSDLTENSFSLYYFSRTSHVDCFKWSYVFTYIKWAGVVCILLVLLMSCLIRKINSYLSSRTKKSLEKQNVDYKNES